MYPYMITYRRTLCSQLHVFSSWLLQDASTLWTMVDDAASSLSAFHMIFHMRFACRQRRLGC